MKIIQKILIGVLSMVLPTSNAEDLGELNSLFEASLDFYGKLQRTPNGMYRDSYLVEEKADQGDRCSTAAVGVGLIALCMEYELKRDAKAAEKALLTLRTLNGKTEGFVPAREKAGYFRHFFSAKTGVGKSEFSTIDTAILVTGALFCRNSFDDVRIKKEVDELWNSIDWELALARPDGTRLHMVVTDGKPKEKTVTQMFNEYYLLAQLIRRAQIQKHGKSEIVSFQKLPKWKHEGLTLLAEPRKTPQPSFLIQFPFYMSHSCTLDDTFAYFVRSQGKADRRSGEGHFWGAGAGVTPEKGYRAASFAENPGRVVSPRIIAGFMPVMPQARADLLKIYRDPMRHLKTSVGNLLPRFSLDHPDWRPDRIEAIDFASMLFGLAGIHPELGMEFFHKKSRFTCEED